MFFYFCLFMLSDFQRDSTWFTQKVLYRSIYAFLKLIILKDETFIYCMHTYFVRKKR